MSVLRYEALVTVLVSKDGIVGEMLKISKYVLIPHLFILFNNILESGIYPNGWCEAILCPLHKNGSVNEVYIEVFHYCQY